MTDRQNKSIEKPAFDARLAGPIEIRHYRFAQKYVELYHNGTRAYLALYGAEYLAKHGKGMTQSVAKASAARLLTFVNVSAHIAEITNELIHETKISMAAVISRYERWADFDISDVIRWKNVEVRNKYGNSYSPPIYETKLIIKDFSELPPEVSDCIQSVSLTKNGINIEPVSKLAANNMLAKFLGLDKPARHRQREMVIHFEGDDY